MSGEWLFLPSPAMDCDQVRLAHLVMAMLTCGDSALAIVIHHIIYFGAGSALIIIPRTRPSLDGTLMTRLATPIEIRSYKSSQKAVTLDSRRVLDESEHTAAFRGEETVGVEQSLWQSITHQ